MGDTFLSYFTVAVQENSTVSHLTRLNFLIETRTKDYTREKVRYFEQNPIIGC